MEHFVTLFNSLFLPQGLALHASMERHMRDYVLWILCVDDEAYDVLGHLDLPNVRRFRLSEYESPELLAVKQSRTIGEYCWTLTPWSIQWALAADLTAKRVTYLDADIFFLKNPTTIFSDLDASGKSFLLTGHNFSPSYEQSSTAGIYCVQFVPVVRGRGETILEYWRDKCMDWCYARSEDGKFGDQKYHEQIASLYSDDVLILNSDLRFMAPWNLDIVPYSKAVLYHFHSFRILDRKKFLLCESYRISQSVIENVYAPYIRSLGLVYSHFHSSGVKFRCQTPLTFKLRLKILATKLVRPFFSFLRRCESAAIVGYNRT